MKLVFIDLHLHTEEKGSDLKALLLKYASNINYVFHLDSQIDPIFIQHGLEASDQVIKNTLFIVKKGQQNIFYFIKLFNELNGYKPNVIMLHGFLHPLHVLLLKIILGNKVKLLIQNHADLPLKGYKSILQRWASKMVDGFIFVSQEQSIIWEKKKLITESGKIFHMMEGSNSFSFKDKAISKQVLNISSDKLFLWVGRLDDNKDPFTILKAFQKYFKSNPNHLLIMIYSTKQLEDQIKDFITEYHLSKQILLKGKLKHEELELYYQAADFFVLGSHYEGSGYALSEAMACGTVPIVTSIPSFKQMTNNGRLAYLFEPGNHEALEKILMNLDKVHLTELSQNVLKKFNEDLSYKAIGRDLSNIIKQLALK